MKRGAMKFGLGAILVSAFVLRAWGITYGLPCSWARPDEDRLIAVSLRVGFSHPDPGYYIWPSLPFYLARPLLEAVQALAGPEASPEALASAWILFLRWSFCLLGVLAVWLVYRLGEKLFSRPTGLTAAAFYAFAFLPVREAHFALLDVPLVVVLLLAFFRLANLAGRGAWRDYLLSGFLIALAAAIKYYGICLVFPLLAAHFSSPRARWGKFFAGLAVLAGTFLLFNPWILLRAGAFWKEVGEGIFLSQFSRGFELVPGAAGTRGGIYHLVFSLRYGLGLPLEILALAGIFYALAAARRVVPWRLVSAFAFCFYGVLAFQKSCFLRYTMPLIPFLALAGAELLVRFLRLVPGRKILLPLAVFLVVLEPGLRALEFDSFISSRPDSRVLSGEWLRREMSGERFLLFPSPLIFPRPVGTEEFPRAVWKSPPPSGEAALALEATGGWLVADEHPLEYSSFRPGGSAEMTSGLRELYRVEGSGAPGTVFDPFDAFYVPLAGFSRASRPGPTLAVYSLP